MEIIINTTIDKDGTIWQLVKLTGGDLTRHHRREERRRKRVRMKYAIIDAVRKIIPKFR